MTNLEFLSQTQMALSDRRRGLLNMWLVSEQRIQPQDTPSYDLEGRNFWAFRLRQINDAELYLQTNFYKLSQTE